MMKLHKWYDALSEPKRFLVFIIPAIMLTLAACNGGPVTTSISLSLILVAIWSRAIYIIKN